MKKLLPALLLCATVNAFAQNTFTTIYNIFQSKCATSGCHTGASPSGGLNLSGTSAQVYNAIVEVTPNNAAAAAKGDKYIDKGYPDRSFLLRKIAHGLSDDLVLTAGEGNNEPNGQAKLSDQEIELVRQWIMWAAPQTGTVVDYQMLTDYYTIGGRPKITRPSAPPAGQGFQIHFGPVFWSPGQEMEYFKKFDPRITQNIEVFKYELYMNSESHHFILRKFRPGEAANWSDGLEPFTIQAFNSGKDFVNAWQTSTDLELPTGTAFFWDPTTILDLNYHMKNYHANEILPGEFYINIWTRPRGTTTVEMKAELIPKLDIFIFGGQTTSFQDHIQRSGQTWNIWMLSTHTHKYGIDYDIFTGNSTNSNNIIYEGQSNFDHTFPTGYYDWSHPPVRRFSPMRTVNMTSGLTHKATYHNTGSSLITWGFTTSGEMMLIYVQYTTQSVNYIPPVNVNGSGPYCGSATLTTDGGMSSYQWSTGDTTQTISVIQSGTYTVTVMDGSGTTYTSNPASVTVLNASVSINGGSNAEVCPGKSVALNAVANATSYSWSTGATTASVNVNAAGTYSVTTTHSNGCTATDDIVVTTAATPVVAVPDKSACVGETVTLDAGNTGATFIWSNGAGTQTVNVTASGTYTVTVTGANGCSAVDASNVIIHSLPSVNINDVSTCTGNGATFNAGNPGSAYSWSTGATSQSITVTQQGTYSVTVTNVNGCSASDFATLTIGTNLIFDIQDISICDGDDIELDAGFAGATYQWSTGATTQSIIVSTAGTYSVTVDQNGCNGSDSGTVSVLPNPVAEAGDDKTICAGETATLTASGGTSYQWSTGAFGASISVDQSGSYNVTVTAANGCSASDKTDVTVAYVNTGNIAGTSYSEPGSSSQYSVTSNSGSSYQWSVTNGTIETGQGASTVMVKWGTMGVGTLSVVETNYNECEGTAVSLQVQVGQTGVSDPLSAALEIFPNPFNATVKISFPNPNREALELRLHDIEGRVVKTIANVSGEELIMNRGDLTSGIYFIELKGSETLRGKVVVTD